MGGLIVLPQQRGVQPQYAPIVASEFRTYDPRIIAVPASRIDLITRQEMAYMGNVTKVNGNFHFPGVVGNADYIDLGAEVVFAPNAPCTIVSITRLESFSSSFPLFSGLSSADGHNLCAFYSNLGGYADLAIGSASLGSQSFSLTPFGSVTGTWHATVFTFDGSSSFSGFKAFTNGLALAPNSSGGLSDATSNNTLGMRSPGDVTFPFPGDIGLFQFYAGQFPDSLAMQVSSNPWMTLRTPPRRIFYSPSTGITLTGAPVTVATLASVAGVTESHNVAGAAATVKTLGGTGVVSQTIAASGAAATVATLASVAGVTESHNISGANAVVATQAGTGAIVIGGITLTASPATVATLGGVGSVTESHNVTGAAATVGTLAGIGAVSEAHNVSGAPAVVATLAPGGSVALGIAITLTATTATVATLGGVGAVSETHSLSGAGATVATLASVGSVTQNQALTGAAATVKTLGGTGAVVQTYLLLGAEAVIPTAASTGAVSQTIPGNITLAGAPCVIGVIAGVGAVHIALELPADLICIPFEDRILPIPAENRVLLIARDAKQCHTN